MGNRWRGVSEYVATLIVSIITLAAGASVFVYSYYVVDRYYSELAKIAEEVRSRSGGVITILASFVNKNGDIIVIGATGSKPITFYVVHINNTFYPNCRIFIDGETNPRILNGSKSIQIPYYIVFKIVCSSSPTVSQAMVKLVYEEGEKIVYASKI